jgi:hypothetical protein
MMSKNNLLKLNIIAVSGGIVYIAIGAVCGFLAFAIVNASMGCLLILFVSLNKYEDIKNMPEIEEKTK